MTRRSGRCLLLLAGALLVMPPGQGLAAGARGSGLAPAASHAGAHRHLGFRPAWPGIRHHRVQRVAPLGYAPFIPLEEGFLSYPTGYMRGDEVPLTRRAPSPPPDPDSFDGMRVRTGIPRPPTPEPTLYRLVGPRDRPATLVTRIAGEGAGRHRHAESGALLLIVPRR